MKFDIKISDFKTVKDPAFCKGCYFEKDLTCRNIHRKLADELQKKFGNCFLNNHIYIKKQERFILIIKNKVVT